MPLEKGGRADKVGNRYEIKCIIYEMLKVLREVNYSVVIEALGDDEVGTDILITNMEGLKEHQQCKIRNASKEYWTISDLNSRGILKSWKKHLERENNRNVSLVSPIGCSYIVDLHERAANTSENPFDFYTYQIKNNSSEFYKFYKDFCEAMGLESEEISGITRSIDFFKRIYLKQMSEYTLKESIEQEISYYFITDNETVYNAFVVLIIDSNIYGKEITASVLRQYFVKHGIHMRMLDVERRILPQIDKINREYKDCFKPLREGLIDRSEFEECIEAINSEKSFIITGNAGYGKSGCAEAILNYCERGDIPYIAIKLDRRIPHGNSEILGKELGFSGSIVYALNTISKNKLAVLVLDQLDALRWTQANSSEALSVCMEMIRQVRYLNNERTKKIVIVFVCREYDLCNDNNIKSLFEKEKNNIYWEEWKKIVIKNFDENVVKKVVGTRYEQLTSKTRRLLQIPGNLYIWQHLDEEEVYNDCTTTSHLIDTWFRQICKKSNNVGVEESVVRGTVNDVVDMLDKIGRLYAPKRVLNVDERGLDYLISAELLIIDGQKVGFVHQSILDYFISNKMMQLFFKGEKIEQIVGKMDKQTPGRRYQVQMFLQNLLEYNSGDFLVAGTQIVESSQIRFYVKYVFYEILRQISEPDERISEYIRGGCEDESRCNYLLKNVVFGKHAYITILRDSGILEQWFSNDKKKNTVFILLKSVSSDLDSEDIVFIRKHAFVNEEDDKQFMGCFLHDIMKESDELFELRMMFYNKYTTWSRELFIDFKTMMKYHESRMIKLISLWLKNKITTKGENVYQYEEELVDGTDSGSLQNGKFVLSELIPYIPLENEQELYYSDWSGRFSHYKRLERVAVELLKRANITIISTQPEYFWEFYLPYMGKNYAIFDELILHGLRFLPESYSNQIIEYLTGDFDKKVFDTTSGAEDQLELVKKVLTVHASHCENRRLNMFIEAVEKYISPQSVEWYKYRMECNKQKEYAPVYWSFWGDFQYHILQCIPYDCLAPRHKQLLNVLDRKFQGKTERYINRDGHSGWVKSPVAGKKIGKKQWLQIITNKRIVGRKNVNWKEVSGGFIESSLDMYARDFETAVKDEPVEMIKMVIENKENVAPVYIDAMYAGAEFSDKFEQVKQSLWEQMFSEFPCDMNSQRVEYFCGIIKKAKICLWSEKVLQKIKEIVIYYYDKREKAEGDEEQCCEKLISRSLNCVEGRAIGAIGHLLWDNKQLFLKFKDVIDKLTLNDDAAVRMACFNVLWPIYNIDRCWSETRILRVYESDVRMAGFHDSKDMFFRLYVKYKERTLLIIKKCFETDDKRLIQIGGYSICEFYIRYNEFYDVISNIEKLSKEQINAILQMAVTYLKYDEYREISKSIILKCKNLEGDFELPLGRMFYDNIVEVERDSEFLTAIMKAKVSRRMVYAFVSFLEKNACSVKDYAEVIIALCENVLEISQEELASLWGIESEISKLIISLYDETANSDNELERKIAKKCLELWDIMFEKQIGQVRELSRMLMER